MASCQSLHPYYFAGGVSTIIGSLIVIISYIFIPKLRYHPSILIFYRAIFDLGLGISFTSLRYLNTHYLICHPTGCNIMGFINLFLFLCSTGSYIALSYHLYQSIKNPFSMPKTQNVKMTNTIIIVSTFLLCAIVTWRSHFAYREKLQFCIIREYNKAEGTFNPYSITFLYAPLSIASIFSLLVTIYAAKRLIKGLPHTFESRKSAICNALWYSTIITFYMGLGGACLLINWAENNENTSIWYKFYAVILPSVGVGDFVVWLITNCDKCKNTDLRERGKSNYQGATEQLKLKHPQDIFKQIQNDIPQESCGKQCCNRIGISVVKDKDNVMINEALRREILAYTTDGISQSVENCEKNSSLTNVHFPQNIKDIRLNVISSFPLKIEKNFGLVGKQPTDRYKKSRVFCRCCCIKSTQYTHEMLQVPLRPISSINIRAVEIDSDFDRSEERQFVDYAPLVFRYIRTKIMKIKDDEYQESITPINSNKQESVLKKSKIGDGKSGAFFFVSHDSKYVVKTLSKTEVKFLITILKDYVEYLKKNPYTILSRYVGLHSLKIYGLTKYFVVMENVFEGSLIPKEIYDLKGSWVNRATNDELHSGTMKDCDLKRPIVMDKQNRDRILMQLNEDTLFLQKHNIMDYSILLGIYYLKIEFQSIKQLVGINERKQEDNNEYIYPVRNSLSGIRARINECPGIYFMGIIDTLQAYSIKKKMETWLKVYIKQTNSNGLSSVEPKLYQKRFMNYMDSVIISEHEYKTRLNIPKQPLTIEKVLIYASSTKNINEDYNYNNRNEEIQIMRSKKIEIKNNNINSNRLAPIRPRTFSSNQLVVGNRFAHSPASFHHDMLHNEQKLEEYEDVIGQDNLDVVDNQEDIAISDIQTNVSTNDSLHDSIRDTESAF